MFTLLYFPYGAELLPSMRLPRRLLSSGTRGSLYVQHRGMVARTAGAEDVAAARYPAQQAVKVASW